MPINNGKQSPNNDHIIAGICNNSYEVYWVTLILNY